MKTILYFVLLMLACTEALAAEHEPPKGDASAASELKTESISAIDVVPVTGMSRNLRALQLVQDRMVSGNIKAVDAQRALLEQMMTALETRDGLSGLTDKDAAQFLPMLLLNGGDPERVRAILGQSGIVSKDPFLLAALAYAEGRVNEALLAFATVDPSALPPISKGQYYLTTGALQAGNEPEKAIVNFAKAQLAAPGTLIEEAALRREALLVLAKPERFLPLVRSYLHRFSTSPFASAFISQFAFSIGDLDEVVQTQIMAELDGLLAKAQTQQRQNFFAILARSSLIGTNNALADYATDRALNEVKDPSQLLSVRLYRAAFDIAGENHHSAAIELQSLARVPLLASDREILTAAISVAQELRRWPFDLEAKGGQAIPVLRNAPIAEARASANMTQAQKLLDDTAGLTGNTK